MAIQKKITAKLKHKKYQTLSIKMIVHTLISKAVYTYYYRYFYNIVQQIYMFQTHTSKFNFKKPLTVSNY